MALMSPDQRNYEQAPCYGSYAKEKLQIDYTALTAEIERDAVAVIRRQERSFQAVMAQVAEEIVASGKKIILLTGRPPRGRRPRQNFWSGLFWIRGIRCIGSRLTIFIAHGRSYPAGVTVL